MPDFIEKYSRPCFAECECGAHGTIIFADGSHSEPIIDPRSGEMIVKELITKGELTTEDGDRIIDHMVCSDMFTNGNSPDIAIAVVALTHAVLKNLERLKEKDPSRN